MMKGTSATPMGSVLFSARTTHSRVSTICLVGSNVGVADSRRRISFNNRLMAKPLTSKECRGFNLCVDNLSITFPQIFLQPPLDFLTEI